MLTLICVFLLLQGFTNVKNLEGGYLSLLKSANPHPTAYHQ
jgi:rhodanese-related sulfurtransferase